MNLICKINDNDIGEEYTELENPKIRLSSRGIVIRNDGKELYSISLIKMRINFQEEEWKIMKQQKKLLKERL